MIGSKVSGRARDEMLGRDMVDEAYAQVEKGIGLGLCDVRK